MYTAFYGLREKPFALSPDPRFLYLAGSHREALAHLLYGIEQGEGFIAVTGEVGTGKTTLCRTLLERLDGDTELAFLFNPSRTALELLQSISAEFGLPAEGLARRALMTRLNEFLLERKREGRRVLLIIDEAQNLSDATLEQVRLLSNLETSREKLIQILLLGQPELDRKLDGRALRQLRQRISVRWKLEPLAAHETRAYVRHRLAVAAGHPTDLFSEAALREVHRRTAGIPRLVNQLCDRALLGGYAARAATIGPRLVRAAAREIPDTRQVRRRRALEASRTLVGRDWMRPWMFVAASLVLVGGALATGLQLGRTGLTEALRATLGPPAAFLVGADPSGAGSRDGAGRPAVAANAPSGLAGRPAGAGAGGGEAGRVFVEDLGDPEAPPVARLIGYVPAEVRRALALKDPAERLNALDAVVADPSLALSPATELRAAEASIAIPPRPVAPRITALAPGLLPRMLLNRAPADALAGSRRSVLDRFVRSEAAAAALAGVGAGPTPAAGSFHASLAAAASRLETEARPAADDRELESTLRGTGLATTRFEGGSLELLRRLDHPVLLPLVPSAEAAARARERARRPDSVDGDPTRHDPEATDRWIAVVGFQQDRAYVAGLLENRIATVPVDEIEQHWREAGLIVWRDYEPLPPLLAPGDAGEGVRWLRDALTRLELLQATDPPAAAAAMAAGIAAGTSATSGPDAEPPSFDRATRDALVEFQARSGLVADGLAGPLTRIALYAQLERYPVPRLSTPPRAAAPLASALAPASVPRLTSDPAPPGSAPGPVAPRAARISAPAASPPPASPAQGDRG